MIRVCWLASLVFIACQDKSQSLTTPWGTVLNQDTINASGHITLEDIINNGELIMLTVSGPDTYYDYHGYGMGLQYLLCRDFAKKMGVSLRVDVCNDTAEMLRKLETGEGDIIAVPLHINDAKLTYCNVKTSNSDSSWVVNKSNLALKDSINAWFNPSIIAMVVSEEKKVLSGQNVKRIIYAPIMSRTKGKISPYDELFKKYASVAGWDWRLIAAQCYQESTFDPYAQSWAGAKGLMQLMPSTARALGVESGLIQDPETNIEAATRLIRELDGKFSDVKDRDQRINYILAGYNAGFFHVRDAMALAEKNGRQKYRWEDVEYYIQALSQPRFYKDPVVKYGYMRGEETVDYVSKIRRRWYAYCGIVGGSSFRPGIPQRATKNHKYKLH